MFLILCLFVCIDKAAAVPGWPGSACQWMEGCGGWSGWWSVSGRYLLLTQICSYKWKGILLYNI